MSLHPPSISLRDSAMGSPDSSASPGPRALRSKIKSPIEAALDNLVRTVDTVRKLSHVYKLEEDGCRADDGLDTSSVSVMDEQLPDQSDEHEPGEMGLSTSEVSPVGAIRGPTILAVNTIHLYAVKILNGNELCTAAKKQILKAYKKQVCQADDVVSQLNRSSFVATQRVPQLEQPLLLHVHLATDAEATTTASRAKYVKVHDREEDGETVKRWMLLGEMMPVPRSSGTTESELKTHAAQEHAKAIGKQEEETICRSQLLDHKSTNSNRSRVAQLVNSCMLSQAKLDNSSMFDDRFLSGGCLFGDATALNCGLEVRDGITVKPGIFGDDGNVHIIQTQYKQHFYQPILLSDFMLAHFGSSVMQCDASKAEELTRILKGVQVIVATSKGGKSRTVQSVTHKTVSSLTTRHNGDEDLIALDELYEDHYGKRLRYPTIPCINIGLAGRNVFVSAEACQLVPDQPFNHKLPFYAGEQMFTLWPELPKLCKSKLVLGDSPNSPFANVDASKLDVLFAEVVVHPDSSRRSDIDQLCVLKKEHWTGFQNSIKCRFKGVISQSVRKFKNNPPIVLPYALRQTEAALGLWAEKLRNALKTKPAAAESSIMVVAVPTGKHNADIYKLLKKICGREIGIQCKVIHTSALSKVLKKPVEGTEQRRFAGAIVRNLLARTLHPPTLDLRYGNDEEYQLRFPAPEEVSKRGVLFGIHIQSIASSKIRTGTGDREWKIVPGQLVTITSSANWITANVLTTHHLLPAVAGEIAADRLSTCLKEHISSSKLLRGQFTHVGLYRSGEGAGRRDQLIVEMNGLVYDHFDSLAGLSMVAYARETVVQVLGDGAVVSSGQRSGLTASERNVATGAADLMHDQGQRKQDRCIVDRHLREMTNAFGLDAAFRKVYVRDLQEVNNAKCAYLLSHVQLDLGGQGQAEQNQAHLGTCYSVLRNTTVPDILHLAQQASKYIQRFVEEVPSGERLVTGEQVMKFELQDVKPELRRTLYYV
ncbi:argonaute 5 [Friedmanniomyces endolithicus]|nr:argonaute 5 [Friedmanniomyces endolithicus]KAK1816847.1 argonaute 5 [Friedmanniomyces endolithicus]